MFLKKQAAQFRQELQNHSQTFEEEHKSASEEFQSNNMESNNQGSSHCQFCQSSNVIMAQLARLKEIVISKNQKIRELQQFIQRLSQMMFNSSGKINQKQMMEIVRSVGQKKEMESDPSETASLNNSKGDLTFYDLNKQMHIDAKHKKKYIQSIIKQEQDSPISSHSRSKMQHMNPTKPFPSALQVKRINSQSTKPLIHSLLPFLPISDHHQSITTQSQPHHQGMIGQIHAIIKPQNNQNQNHRDLKSSTASLKVLSKRAQI